MTNNTTTTVTKDNIELSSNPTSSNLEYTRVYDSISREVNFYGSFTMDHGLPILRPTLHSLVASCQHALVSERQREQQQQQQNVIDPLLLLVPPCVSFCRTRFDADYASPSLLSEIIDEALQITTAINDSNQLFRQ